MVLKKWFCLLEQRVSGPYTESEVEVFFSKSVTREKILIWGKGSAEWLTHENWLRALKNPDIRSQLSEAQVRWHFFIPSHAERERLSRPEGEGLLFRDLLARLKNQPDMDKVWLWNSHGEEWKPIFLVEEVADELGVSRRSHPRVPILGQFVLSEDESQNKQQDKQQKYNVVTLSEGGFGIGDVFDLQIGDQLKGSLHSPQLFIVIPCTAEVVFVGEQGFVGLRFMGGLAAESRSAVIEYIRRFDQKDRV